MSGREVAEDDDLVPFLDKRCGDSAADVAGAAGNENLFRPWAHSDVPLWLFCAVCDFGEVRS